VTALPQLPEPAHGSCGERIVRRLAALAQARVHTEDPAGGIQVFDGASLDAGIAAGIVILCERGQDDHRQAPIGPRYIVHTALTARESPLPDIGERSFGLSIRFDLQVAAELILALDGAHAYPRAPATLRAPLPLDEAMANAVLRLLHVLACPVEASILGPGIVRELLYRVLTGPQGDVVRAALCRQGNMKRIGKALRRIREGYAGAFDVSALAKEAGMSVAAFHARFKEVTQTTPIQFLKTTRLQQARLLMVRDGAGAASASRLVGYESTSQFSREFKRLFGRTPTEEAARVRAVLRPGDAQHRAAHPAPDYHSNRNSGA
jgi:AraC-like DNA-binding protein